MLGLNCPLKPTALLGKVTCDENCAWLLPDGAGKPKRCVATWIPRLTEAMEAQTALVKGLIEAGLPALSGDT